MKARVAAKRRWFTSRNGLRIAYRTRWARLESSLAAAILAPSPVEALVQALKAEMRQTMERVMRDVIIRPMVAELMSGVSSVKPKGFFTRGGPT